MRCVYRQNKMFIYDHVHFTICGELYVCIVTASFIINFIILQLLKIDVTE